MIRPPAKHRLLHRRRSWRSRVRSCKKTRISAAKRCQPQRCRFLEVYTYEEKTQRRILKIFLDEKGKGNRTRKETRLGKKAPQSFDAHFRAQLHSNLEGTCRSFTKVNERGRWNEGRAPSDAEGSSRRSWRAFRACIRCAQLRPPFPFQLRRCIRLFLPR